MKRLLFLLPLAVLCGCEANVDRDAEIEYLLMPGMEDRDLPFSRRLAGAKRDRSHPPVGE